MIFRAFIKCVIRQQVWSNEADSQSKETVHVLTREQVLNQEGFHAKHAIASGWTSNKTRKNTNVGEFKWASVSNYVFYHISLPHPYPAEVRKACWERTQKKGKKTEIKGERKGKFIPPPTTTRSHLKYGECVNLKVRISITLEVIFELLFLWPTVTWRLFKCTILRSLEKLWELLTSSSTVGRKEN